MGCCKGEQPLLGKEGIGPAAVILRTTATVAALPFELAQDRAQPAAHKPIQYREGRLPGMFEVPEPAPQHGVEVLDRLRQSASPLAAGQLPHAVTHLRAPARYPVQLSPALIALREPEPTGSLH